VLYGLNLWLYTHGLDPADWPGRALFRVMGEADDHSPTPQVVPPSGPSPCDRGGPGDLRAASQAGRALGGGNG